MVSLATQDAKSVAKAFFEAHVVHFGVSWCVHTDQGLQAPMDKLKDIISKFSIFGDAFWANSRESATPIYQLWTWVCDLWWTKTLDSHLTSCNWREVFTCQQMSCLQCRCRNMLIGACRVCSSVGGSAGHCICLAAGEPSGSTDRSEVILQCHYLVVEVWSGLYGFL